VNLLLVALGGAAGSMLRYGAGVLRGRSGAGGWPLGTSSVNVIGGLLMGPPAGWLAHTGGEGAERWRLLLARACSAASPPSPPFRSNWR
jgi:CrcB protein